jgi:pimeloyl-ACP methyl ester carboxylesterase
MTNVLDLRGHGLSLPMDFTTVTMEDYVADLDSVTAQIAAQGRPPVLVGWGMGGLVAMIHASRHPDTPGLVLLSPSSPQEVLGRTPAAQMTGFSVAPYGPETYGIVPDDIEASRAAAPDLTAEELASVLEQSRGALESGVARRERRRGMSVPAAEVRCPVLVMAGDKDALVSPETNQKVAEHFGGECLVLPGASHWGIVYHGPTVADAAGKLDTWLRRTITR